MADSNLAAACGLYCAQCEHLGKQCRGCGNQAGKPFWTTHAKVAVCPLYDCCVNKKRLEHCGLCAELPCELFMNFYDPSLSPEEAEKAIRARQADLIRRKEIGTEQWLKEKAG